MALCYTHGFELLMFGVRKACNIGEGLGQLQATSKRDRRIAGCSPVTSAFASGLSCWDMEQLSAKKTESSNIVRIYHDLYTPGFRPVCTV